jgi:biopolymer transport protein ExbD
MSARTIWIAAFVVVVFAGVVYWMFERGEAARHHAQSRLVSVEIPVKGSKEKIIVAVDRQGKMTWNGKPISCEEMRARFRKMEGKPDAAEARAEDRKHCAVNVGRGTR